jgi:hypothetical protein
MASETFPRWIEELLTKGRSRDGFTHKIDVDGWKARRPETGRKYPFFGKDRDED